MHRSYQSILPAQNKFLQKRWDTTYYNEHKRKVSLAVQDSNNETIRILFCLHPQPFFLFSSFRRSPLSHSLLLILMYPRIGRSVSLSINLSCCQIFFHRFYHFFCIAFYPPPSSTLFILSLSLSFSSAVSISLSHTHILSHLFCHYFNDMIHKQLLKEKLQYYKSSI